MWLSGFLRICKFGHWPLNTSIFIESIVCVSYFFLSQMFFLFENPFNFACNYNQKAFIIYTKIL